MSLQGQALLVVACALVSVAYISPTLVCIARHGKAASRVVVINALLGWTVVGWIVAFRLASRPARPASRQCDWSPWVPGRPEAARRSRAATSTYVDGSYLISEEGDARTWAVCAGGRWGIAYELDGVQRTGAWVDATDVPVHILAHALLPYPECQA